MCVCVRLDFCDDVELNHLVGTAYTWLCVSRCECVYVLACLCVLDFCDGVELGQLVGTGLYMALCIEVQCPGGG